MSAVALAFLVGLTVLLAALFIVVMLWWREATQLSRFVVSSTRSNAAEQLRGPLGDSAVVLERALTSKRVDEGLAASIVTVCQAPLGAPLIQGLAIDTLLVVGALAPLLAALLSSASAIAALPSVVGTRGDAYVAAVAAIPAAFAGIGQGARLSVVLVVLAGVVAVCRYALLRPEAREARAIHALASASADGAPDVRVPQSAKLLALLAPSASLVPAIGGSILFAVLSAAGVAALVVSAPLRAANTVPLTYLRWPTLYVESTDILAPAVAAGRPLQKGPSLIFSREQVQLGGNTMIDLREGRLPEGWTTIALLPATIGADAQPLVVAAEATPLDTVYGALLHVGQRYGLSTHQLVVRRFPPAVRAPAARVQAALPVSIGDPSALGVVLEIDAKSVRLGGEPLDLERADGLRKLRSAVSGPDRRVGVRAHHQLDYGRLVAILGLADGLCDGGVDCGLPGRGLSFTLTLLPASE